MVKFVIKEEIDSWDIIKTIKLQEKLSIKMVIYIQEMWENLINKEICKLLEELKNLLLQVQEKM